MLYLTLFAACLGQMLQPAPLVVTATAYTCEPVAANPMHPCGPLRWGGEVAAPGMACPPAWRDRAFQVPTRGVLRCDDTPRDSQLHGRPHVDVRAETLEEARAWGIQILDIHPITEPSPWSTKQCWTFSRRARRSPAPSPSLSPSSPRVRHVDHE